jgi:hypothetical protein
MCNNKCVRCNKSFKSAKKNWMREELRVRIKQGRHFITFVHKLSRVAYMFGGGFCSFLYNSHYIAWLTNEERVLGPTASTHAEYGVFPAKDSTITGKRVRRRFSQCKEHHMCSVDSAVENRARHRRGNSPRFRAFSSGHVSFISSPTLVHTRRFQATLTESCMMELPT